MRLINFESLKDGKTKMVLCHAGMPAGEIAEDAVQGWNQSFD